MPEMTDEQLAEAIRGMGKEVTEERKKNMRDMMARSKTRLTVAKLKGSSTELHEHVSSPELSKDDFAFALPKGTLLKDSLFGAMFSGDRGSPNKVNVGGRRGHRIQSTTRQRRGASSRPK